MEQLKAEKDPEISQLTGAHKTEINQLHKNDKLEQIQEHAQQLFETQTIYQHQLALFNNITMS